MPETKDPTNEKKKTVTGNMKEQKICYNAHTALSCPRAPRTIVCVLR